MNAVERCQGIEVFFDRLFGFFKRKTDLYDDESYTLTILDSYVKKHMAEYRKNKRVSAKSVDSTTISQSELENTLKNSNEKVIGKYVVVEETKAASMSNQSRQSADANNGG